LESTAGVTTSGSTVTGWNDQSGNGNDLSADGDPVALRNATPAGTPAVSFDGDGDALVRTAGLTGFPTLNQDRSVFLVAEYQSPGYGGFTYGKAACNNAFGLVADDTGDLAVQGWCGSNDYSSGIAATGAGWLTQAAIVEGSTLSHYRNGTLIDTAGQTYQTDDDRLVLGAEFTPAPYLDMEVAAVLVYDRTLSDTERQQVERYLDETYLNASGTSDTNAPPTARNDAASVVRGESVTVDVLANDSDPDGSLDASSVAVVDRPTNGSVVVNTTTGEVTYTNDGSSATRDSFTYTVIDDDGAVSNEAAVAIDVTDQGLDPTDPDGDGLYEDVNGDGSVNAGDAQALFANLNDPAVQSDVDAFDFNGDGSIDVGDAQALFATEVESSET
jgi:hypothetical protein